MLDDFFHLNNTGIPPQVFSEFAALEQYFQASSELDNAVIAGGTTIPPRTRVFIKKRFFNVSFSRVRFEHVLFKDCTFKDCLFISTQFVECVFEDCKFLDCNLWKATFSRVTVDPAIFKIHRSYRNTHANVGLGLFRRLHRNAAEMSDPEFSATADLQRRRWLRAQERWEWQKGGIDPITFGFRYIRSLAFDWMASYGYSPLRFLLTSALGFYLISRFVHENWTEFGFARNGNPMERDDIIQTAFYTSNILTTLGFTDILPSTDAGRLYSIALAAIGVAWVALFTTMLIRRVLR